MNVPECIMHIITSFLPVESLCMMRSVCSAWQKIQSTSHQLDLTKFGSFGSFGDAIKLYTPNHLQTLILPRIRDEFANIATLVNLQHLNLGFSNITDEQLVHVGELLHLRQLILVKCENVTNTGLKHVEFNHVQQSDGCWGLASPCHNLTSTVKSGMLLSNNGPRPRRHQTACQHHAPRCIPLYLPKRCGASTHFDTCKH